MKFIRILSLSFTLAFITNCAPKTDEKVENNLIDSNFVCILNDTLINKFYYGINYKKYQELVEDNSNLKMSINTSIMSLSYTPHFINDSLFSLDVDVQQHDPYKNSNFKGLLNVDAFTRMLFTYKEKYGKASLFNQSGSKGLWIDNFNSEIFHEYGEFMIHNIYEWNCNNKAIKIKFDFICELKKDIWNQIGNEDDILKDTLYNVLRYDNFKINYTNIKMEKEFGQYISNKIQEEKNNEKMKEKKEKQKLKENI